MINPEKYIGDLLAGYAPLVTLLGSASKIEGSYPRDYISQSALPKVTFEIVNEFQSNKVTWDDVPQGFDLAVQIDVWVAENASPVAIINAVRDCMNAADFFQTANRRLPDLNNEIDHRQLVFTVTKGNESLNV